MRRDFDLGGATLGGDFFATSEKVQPASRRLQRNLLRSLLRAEQLRANLFMSEQEFAALAVHRVLRLQNARLTRGRSIDVGTFGIWAAQALSPTYLNLAQSTLPSGLTKATVAADTLWHYLVQQDPRTREACVPTTGTRILVWGPMCEDLLLSARRRNSRWWRRLWRTEEWLTGIHTVLPLLTRWLYAALGFTAGALVTYLLGR